MKSQDTPQSEREYLVDAPSSGKGRSLRVVNIVTQMEGGGAQGAAMRVAARLRARGYLAETWFLYEKRPTYKGHEGVRVMVPHPPRHGTDYLRVFFGLVRELREFRPDAIVTYTHYANVMGQVAASLVGVRCCIASQRNPAWTYPWLARWADYLLGTTGFYTFNIAVSQSVQESFSRYPSRYIRRLRVIHNGIAFSCSGFTQREARKILGLPTNAPLVVAVGRLAYQKNQIVLINAFASLSTVHLAIAGDGELRHELRRAVQERGVASRVHFLGELQPSQIPTFLAAGDIFVMPSLFEGHSNVLLEAMSAGLPIVSSDIPAQAEVLRVEGQEPAGLLLPATDAQVWAAAIRRFLNDDELRGKFARRSLKRASVFSIERMVDAYEECIREGVGDGVG